MFAKIFSQIFDSSIANDHVIRHVFMDLLVLADRDGVVDMTHDAISRRTNVPIEIVTHALAELSKVDASSRSKEEGGRRIVPLDSGRDWGWQVVNYEHYREIRDEEARRTYFRDKKREQRAKPKVNVNIASNVVRDSQTNSTQGEAEGDVEAEVKGNDPRAFAEVDPGPEATYDPAADPLENIPEGLHAVQYAHFVADQVGIAAGYALKVKLGDVLGLLCATEALTMPQAVRALIDRMKAAGRQKWLFWLEDGGWKASAGDGAAEAAFVGQEEAS